MVKDGIILAIAFAAAGVGVGQVLDPRLGLPLFVAAAFFLFFFRDPDRKISEGDLVVSPADGSVAMIQPFGEDQQRISIFLSVFDVHVNRSPIGGRITAVDYRKGKFVNAMRADASDENERNVVEVRADDGSTVAFSQIAGLLARRIVFRPKVGDRVEKGERVGMIKFGSRVDVFLGPEWEIVVQPNDVVAGGSSVLARRLAAALVRGGREPLNKAGAEAEL